MRARTAQHEAKARNTNSSATTAAKGLPRVGSLDDLIEQTRGQITVACDTEYAGPHTLSVQLAARLGDDLLIQMYSSPAVPRQPEPGALKALLPRGAAGKGRRLFIREGRRLSAGLSPARALADLFGIEGVEPAGTTPPAATGPPPALTVTFIAHFWAADLFRVFGREFWADLLDRQVKGGRL